MDSQISGGVSFPGGEEICHDEMAGEAHDGMEMVGHQEEKAEVPLPLLMVKPGSLQKCGRGLGLSQLHSTALVAVHGNEKKGAIVNPMRDVVMEPLAIGKIVTRHGG